MEDSPDRIKIDGQHGLIFSSDDVIVLREKYRIVGCLIGCHPKKPLQNVQLGMPLQLLPEEIALLREKNLADVVVTTDLHVPPSEEERVSHNKACQLLFEQQETLHFEKQRADFERLKEVIEEGKRAKYAQLDMTSNQGDVTSNQDDGTSNQDDGTSNQPNGSSNHPDGSSNQGDGTCSQPDQSNRGDGTSNQRDRSSNQGDGSSNQGDSRSTQNDEAEKTGTEMLSGQQEATLSLRPLYRSSALVQTPNATFREVTFQPYKWDFPRTSEEILRYRTFKDFWEKGFYLTSGSKFGGDFLVYPGDPSRCHSFYIAVCVPYQKKMPLNEVISLGRLAVTVKKTVVLCSLNDYDEVTFTSLNWSHVS